MKRCEAPKVRDGRKNDNQHNAYHCIDKAKLSQSSSSSWKNVNFFDKCDCRHRVVEFRSMLTVARNALLISSD